MITVILLCWKRFQHFEEILKFWLNQEKVTQVIVFDNSGTFKTDLPILLFNINKNLGPGIRVVASQFAINDTIIFCDDDTKMTNGIIEDLLKYFDKDKVVGVMGKKFTGSTYKNSPVIRGNSIEKPVEVDYIPYNLCITHRKNCLVDIRECPNQFYIDDWWWCREAKKKGVTFWIAPSGKYSWYPEGNDADALHLNKKLLKYREDYFKKWILNEVDN